MKDYGEDNDGSDDGDEEDEQDDDAADCDEAGKNGGGVWGVKLGLPGAQHHMSSLKLSNTYVGTQNSKLIAKYDSLFG